MVVVVTTSFVTAVSTVVVISLWIMGISAPLMVLLTLSGFLAAAVHGNENISRPSWQWAICGRFLLGVKVEGL